MTRSNNHSPRATAVKPWVRTRRIMLAVAFLLFIAPCIIIVSAKYFSDQNLAGYVEEIRAEGMPASVDDLPAWQANLAKGGEGAAEADKTAAALYLQAIALLDSADNARAGDAINGVLAHYDEEGMLSPEAKEQLGSYAAANAPVLELLRQAVALPAGAFPVDYTRGWDMDLPHADGIRRAARLLRAETAVSVLENDPQRAVNAVAAAVALSRPLRNEPVLSSQLLRLGCNNTALRALAEVLGVLPFSEGQLGRLQELFAEAYPADAFSNALISERTFALLVFQNPALMFGEDEDAGLPGLDEYELPMYQKASAPSVFLAERSRYFSGMKELIAAMRLPYPEAQAVFERVAGPPRLRFRTRSGGGSDPDRAAVRHHHPPRGGLRGMFMTYTRLPQAMARDRARLNQGVAALAVERYRLTHGKTPERLEELIPQFVAAVPLDPFDLQPLRYRREENAFVIYSVSVNGKDENGEKGEFADQGDLPFRVQYKQ